MKVVKNWYLRTFYQVFDPFCEFLSIFCTTVQVFREKEAKQFYVFPILYESRKFWQILVGLSEMTSQPYTKMPLFQERLDIFRCVFLLYFSFHKGFSSNQ